MKIVIDIPSEMYDWLDNGFPDEDDAEKLWQIVKNGIPLPKGHGRLIDASRLKVELECGIRAGNYEKGYEKYPHINSMDDCVDAVEYADTIIEADTDRKREDVLEQRMNGSEKPNKSSDQ